MVVGSRAEENEHTETNRRNINTGNGRDGLFLSWKKALMGAIYACTHTWTQTHIDMLPLSSSTCTAVERKGGNSKQRREKRAVGVRHE